MQRASLAQSNKDSGQDRGGNPLKTVFGKGIGDIIQGIGLGGVGASIAGKKEGIGSSLGGLLGGAVSFMNPFSMVLGGLLGSMFDNGASQQQAKVEQAKIEYAKESNAVLQFNFGASGEVLASSSTSDSRATL